MADNESELFNRVVTERLGVANRAWAKKLYAESDERLRTDPELKAMWKKMMERTAQRRKNSQK
ncbi:hypothetical protein AWR36_006130 [Microbulbifer flavimaris]|uniref:Uncharacterized protein n=1 Tax=Microbulbifer flavimaris TaxID=1781068 RepID=A0ABX4HZL5_9GAMM|nr:MULTISPECIES: hypothetical protein [Microbulbifer]KUJ83436.1 hypothetical protein AVO43_06115 [Microbulbifer sp. ZGT114]PCO05592.1 hypothetical protein AWR36_006130 [Microbulbifer flavimaris]